MAKSCQACRIWKKEAEYWQREAERHKEVCRELSKALDRQYEEREASREP